MDFTWIGDFLRWVVHLLPFHMGICTATEGGVKFVHGHRVREIVPGRYWHWPLFTRTTLIAVKRQPLEIAGMSETTADDQTIHVEPIVIYEVADVVRAIVETHDYDQTAAEVAKAAVVAVVTTRTKDELRVAMVDEIPRELTKRIRAALKPYGLHVIEARLSEMASERVYRHVGGEARYVEEDEE